MTSLVAAAAMEKALIALKTEGEYAEVPIFDFKAFCGLMGIQEVCDFAEKWAKQPA